MANIEELGKIINDLTLNEARDLVKILTEKYGYSLPEPTVVKEVKEEIKEEKTQFNVLLMAIGGEKLKVIKEYANMTGKKLMEGKALIESTIPVTLAENITKTEAETMKNSLESFGATVAIT